MTVPGICIKKVYVSTELQYIEIEKVLEFQEYQKDTVINVPLVGACSAYEQC